VGADLVIFDCDGVLVDSDRISLRVQAERLCDLGLETSYADCVRDYSGLGMAETLRIIGERLGRPVPEGWEEELAAAVAEAFRVELLPVDGIAAALDQIEPPNCVASNGSQEKMRLSLGLTGLWERFAGRIYSGDEVPRKKPAPDLFLHAAATEGTPPERCVVVEDSPVGVAAALAAGMPALGYAPEDPQRLRAAGATVFSSMTELPALLGA
jgi:HAD superfamily hydrolase (TIGR01509 family)